ncbi:MAG: hypothetical protein ABI758_06205 [Candidatus Woesebacteria bacterium]
MSETDSQPEQDSRPKEITDHKILGTIDASVIPPGYGIVDYDQESSQVLVTNNTGDVRLFIDPDTRETSSMELKEVEWDAGAFLSGISDVPQEFQDSLASKEFPKKFHVTKSHEGTEFVHGIGNGDAQNNPIEIVQKSTHVYKDVSVIHLAMAKTAQLRKTPIYASLNEILFTYSPKGNQVEISATASFKPPRDFDDIEKDIKADIPTAAFEVFYYTYLVDNPDVFKTPIEWYREEHGTGIDTALSMFERVKERIKQKDL